MRKSWAVGLIIISILTMACGGAADVDDYKAAFVYLGSANDGGWTQAHDEGRQYLVEETGIETAFTEDVPPDATEFRTVAEAYIEQGYNIIFGTTFGYLDIMEEMALEYPDVTFLHCSGYKSNYSNYTNYFGKIYLIEANYNYGRLEKIVKGWRGKIYNYSVTHGGGIHLIDLIIQLTNIQRLVGLFDLDK